MTKNVLKKELMVPMLDYQTIGFFKKHFGPGPKFLIGIFYFPIIILNGYFLICFKWDKHYFGPEILDLSKFYRVKNDKKCFEKRVGGPNVRLPDHRIFQKTFWSRSKNFKWNSISWKNKWSISWKINGILFPGKTLFWTRDIEFVQILSGQK